MKNTFGQIIVSLLVTVIAGVAVYYFTTRAAPDVRYTLSEKIPVTFADPTNTTLETVQQLEIKNIGNAEAQKIVVKIKGQIIAYTINKYSASDNIQVFDQQQPIEIVYSQLPPQAGFKIVFKTESEGIEYSDVTVSHSTGLACEALSRTNSSLSALFSLGLFAFYAILSAITLRSNLVDIWKSGLRHKDIGEIILKNKPWYSRDSEWSQARLDAAKETVSKNDAWRNINKVQSYQFLIMDKPNSYSNTEWKEITDRAIDDLENKYQYNLNTAISSSEIIELLNVERPQYFPEIKWEKLEKEANKQYVSLMKKDTYSQEIVTSLKGAKPKKISQAAWQELMDYWEAQYYQIIIERLRYTYDLFDYIDKLDTSVLSDDHRSALDEYLSKLILQRKVRSKSGQVSQF